MTFKVLTLVEVIEALMRAEASSAGDFRVTKQVVEVDVPALVASHEALREACDELLRCEEIRNDGTDWAEEEERHIAFQFALREDQIRALSADLKRLETETGVAEVKAAWREAYMRDREAKRDLRAKLAASEALAAQLAEALNALDDHHNSGLCLSGERAVGRRDAWNHDLVQAKVDAALAEAAKAAT